MARALKLLCLVLVVTATRPSGAQDNCIDSTEATYLEQMSHAREAIGVEDFSLALHHLEQAKLISQPAVLDFAIARALHHLERWDDAVDAYSRFLHRFEACDDPHDLRPTAIEFRTVALRNQAAVMTQAETGLEPEPTPVAATDPAAAPTAPVEAGGAIHPAVYLLSAGGALVATGVLFDLTRADLGDELTAAYEVGDVALANELEDDWQRGEKVEWALYGTGIAALAVGTVMLLTMSPPSDEEGLSVRPSLGASCGVVVGGSF